MFADVSPMKSFAFFLVLSALFFAGCSTTDNLRPVNIAGGRVMPIPFGPHGPINGAANGYEVQYASSVPGASATKLVYKFAFSAQPGVTLKRVVVDDISDEQSFPSLVDDRKPWIDGNLWRGESQPFDDKDPILKWVY